MQKRFRVRLELRSGTEAQMVISGNKSVCGGGRISVGANVLHFMDGRVGVGRVLERSDGAHWGDCDSQLEDYLILRRAIS